MRPATNGSAVEADSPRCQGGRKPERSAPVGRASVKARGKRDGATGVGTKVKAASRRPKPERVQDGYNFEERCDIEFVSTAGGVGLGKRSATAARRREAVASAAPDLVAVHFSFARGGLPD